MRARAAKFNLQKIKPQDLAGAGGPPNEEAQEAVLTNSIKYVRSDLGVWPPQSDGDFSFGAFCVRATDSESVARPERMIDAGQISSKLKFQSKLQGARTAGLI